MENILKMYKMFKMNSTVFLFSSCSSFLFSFHSGFFFVLDEKSYFIMFKDSSI